MKVMENQTFEVTFVRTIVETSKAFVVIPRRILDEYTNDEFGVVPLLDGVIDQSPALKAEISMQKSTLHQIPKLVVDGVKKVGEQDINCQNLIIISES